MDKLTFYWDNKVTRSRQTSSKIKDESTKDINLEAYFNFLEEIKTHEQELRRTSLFNKTFTLV